MKVKTAFLMITCMVLIANCAYLKTRRDVHFKSYSINVEEQAVTGVPMITSEHMEYATGTRQYGLVEEQDHWQSFDYPTQHQFKEELIYKGRSDNTVYISYKQYKKGLATPAISRELSYDLGYSDIIMFNNYKIKVLNATSEYIRFRVISD